MANFVDSKLIPDMHKQIIVSMEAVKSQMYTGKGFFELFGYDFIVDADYDSWLIEVNTNPSIEESSPLLKQIIPRMVNDAFRLTLDQTFLPKKGQTNYDPLKINVFEVDGVDNQENLWVPILNLQSAKGQQEKNKKVFIP